MAQDFLSKPLDGLCLAYCEIEDSELPLTAELSGVWQEQPELVYGMDNREIDHPNAHYLMAAQGWMELGDCDSAIEELDHIDESFGSHPMVLMVRWHTHAKSHRWDVCIKVGRALTEVCPDSPFGWINLCNALYFEGQTQEAYDTLTGVLRQFPGNELLPYNLACYACQLSRLEEARSWLHEAFLVGDVVDLKEKAVEDPDLEPLWDEIQGMS